MLIPKKNRKEVYKYLFQEGVLYAEKDFNLAKHPEIPDVPNLQVIKLMQSFKSKEFLTDEGIDYLREYLNLPVEIVPATMKKSTRALEKGGDRPPRRDYEDRPRRDFGGGGGGGGGGYRDSYRSGSGGGFGRGGGFDGEKGGDAPGDYRPQYGFGRGAPAQ